MDYQTTYFVNLRFRDKFHGYQPDHGLAYVGTIYVTADTIAGACEAAFHGFNRIDEPVPVLDNAQAPSMSVGDVLCVRDTTTADHEGLWFSCEGFGFQHIERPQCAIDYRPIPEIFASDLRESR